jgi:hypothetical protein
VNLLTVPFPGIWGVPPKCQTTPSVGFRAPGSSGVLEPPEQAWKTRALEFSRSICMKSLFSIDFSQSLSDRGRGTRFHAQYAGAGRRWQFTLRTLFSSLW